MSGWGDAGDAWADAGRAGGRTSYQRAGDVESGDSKYLGQCNAVRDALQKLDRCNRKVQQFINKLGGPKDTKNMRDKLHRALHDGSELTQLLQRHLQDLQASVRAVTGSEQKQRNLQRQKCAKESAILVQTFKDLTDSALAKERQQAARHRASMSEVIQRRDSGDAEAAALLQQQAEALNFVQLEDVERENDILAIQQNLVDVRDTFADLATMVDGQREDIDTIGWNIEEAHDRTERGVKHIEQARKYQKSSSKKVCCIFVTTVVIAAAVGLILFFHFEGY